MSLSAQLAGRAAEGRPIRVGLIGAGKLGTTYLAQALRTPGIHVVGVADVRAGQARLALSRAGFAAERCVAESAEDAARFGTTWVTDDAGALIAAPHVDVIIEATGSPSAGVRHALRCAGEAKHLVMANLEADALCGPLLAERVRAAGAVYSLASGDQAALVCELVDWARTNGFEIVAAGKGTRHLPRYVRSTPETVFTDFGLTPEQVAASGMNPRRCNAVLDGTKSAIEMAAVVNATMLEAPAAGLGFPPCGVRSLPQVLRPRADGGILDRPRVVEVVSSVARDGEPVPDDLRWGVYVVVAAGSAYVSSVFAEYGLATDESGRYAALWRPAHLVGLELGATVASVALRNAATGAPVRWAADVVAVAKRELSVGTMLDGEGGYTVYGKLMPAEDARRAHALPIGLAAGARLKRAVKTDDLVTSRDVELDGSSDVVRARTEMERTFA